MGEGEGTFCTKKEKTGKRGGTRWQSVLEGGEEKVKKQKIRAHYSTWLRLQYDEGQEI